MHALPLSSVVALLTPLAISAAQGPARDEAPALLRARLQRPVMNAAPARLGTAGPGNRLFHMIGGDNAECVRAVPDVNGDGRDEILVGIGQSGTDNVFCLDGASSGAGTVVWSLETSSGVSGGSCYGDQCIVLASDSESSGHANVLLGTAWGGRTAFDLDTLAGAELWRFDTYLQVESGWVYSLCEVSDVTGDGVPEVAFGTGSFNDRVHLVDGASTGQADVLWSYFAGDAVYSVRNLGDVNGDGTDDVLAAVGDDVDRIVCLEGDSTSPGGHVLWQYTPNVTVFACGVLSDVTGDGIDEALAVLWTSTGTAIRCRNGATGAAVWASTAVTEFAMMVDEIQDVTGDGQEDVVVSSWENAVIVLDGFDGSLSWKTSVGTTNGGDVWTARAIDDLNGDARQDVVAGSFDTHVYALDGDSGEIFWAFDTDNRVFSVAPVGDLNGDGRPEVVAGTQDTTTSTVVHVLEGDAGIVPPDFPHKRFLPVVPPFGPSVLVQLP